MGPKAYSILFSALLFSTFVHEIRAKGLPLALERQVREVSPPTSSCEPCTSVDPPTDGLQLLVNATTNIVVVVNVTAQVAVAIDIAAQVIVLLNGETGVAIAIDLVANTGAVINAQISSLVWIAADLSIQAYLATLVSLRVFLQVSAAVKFVVATASSAVLSECNEIVAHLFIGISADLEVNAKLGLELVIKVSVKLIVLLNGVLAGLLNVIGAVIITLTGDLAFLLNVLVGIAVVIGRITGGLAALIDLGLALDLQIILGARNGIQACVNLLLQIGLYVDLSVVLGSILNSVELLLQLVVLLGGNVSVGITGLIKVLVRTSGTLELDVEIKLFLDLIDQQTTQWDNSNGLTVFIKIITSLLEGTLIVAKINISAIITLILNGLAAGTAVLVIVVGVLLLLVAVVDIVVALLSLIIVLILNLNTCIGIEIVEGCGISIDISITAVVGGLLKIVLQGINILSILLGVGGNVWKLLTALPVIKDIAIAVAAAVKIASNGTIDLVALLSVNLSISVVLVLKAILQIILGVIIPGVTAAVLVIARALLELIGGVYIHIGLDVALNTTANATVGGLIG